MASIIIQVFSLSNTLSKIVPSCKMDLARSLSLF